MSEEIDGGDKINTAAPGEGVNTDGDNDGGSGGPPMSMRGGGRGGFR